MAKARASRTTQTVAEGYEECVYRRFRASEAIRHEKELGFMFNVFRSFNSLLGQRQQPTMAYRPQALDTAKRMAQTLIRSIKLYAADVGHQDWNEYAERLTFAINTTQDRVRKKRLFIWSTVEMPDPTLKPRYRE